MDYQIQTEFQGPGFVAVPNAVAQGAISAEALGVLVYLASQPRGFLARVASIQERFGIGRDKWQRIARELREAGAMQLHTIRGQGGRAIGRRMVVRWPEVKASEAPAAPEGHAPENPADGSAATENRVSRCSDRKPGFPTVGKPAKDYRQTRKTRPANPVPYKEEENKTARRRAARPQGRPAATGAQAQGADREAVIRRALGPLADVPSRLVGSRREFQGPDGHWYQKPRDPEEAAQFAAWCQKGAAAPDRRAS